MRRSTRFALMLAGVLTAASPARAQYGYGGGWGGWGGASTPGSSMARGLGMMSMGAGMYNRNTAQARSINANTAMRWNQAMFNGSRVGARMFNAREKALKEQNETAYSGIRDRIRNHPTSRDVTDGDALNAVLDVLLNPTNADTSIQQIKTPIRPETIANIPFEVASEGMTVCLDRMTMDGQWPQAVSGDEFKAERDGLRKAIQAALEEDKQGEVDPDTIAAVQAAINRLRDKFEKLVPQTSPDYVSAHWAIKAMDGLTKMLYSPQMDKVLSELEDYQGSTIGDLLSFMQAFNLRFGPANSYRQRLIYQKIYPMLAEQANASAGSGGDGDVTAVAADAASNVAKVGGDAIKTAEAAGGDAIDSLKSAAINFFKEWK
jgi:hypothetical protein